MGKIIAVVDTNVYLSAFLFGGKPKKVIDLAPEGKIKIVISIPILEEIREKLKYKFKISQDKIEELTQEILNFTTVTKVFKTLKNISIDQKDNPIIETAIKGDAKYIVTGDYHLLKLKEYRSIKILKPAEFLERLNL